MQIVDMKAALVVKYVRKFIAYVIKLGETTPPDKLSLKGVFNFVISFAWYGMLIIPVGIVILATMVYVCLYLMVGKKDQPLMIC